MKYVPRHLHRTADVSRGTQDWRSIAGDLAIVIAFLLGFYVLLGIAASAVAAYIPDAWESQLPGASLFAFESSDDGTDAVQRVFDKLLQADTLRPLNYRLVVVDLEQPNAFAVAGGTVAVTRGLLGALESEVGLAMVLAHELGHHQERHVLERLGRSLFLVVPMALVGGDASGWLWPMLSWLEGKYSRDQEREADRIGIDLVHTAYGQTDGVLEFFEHMRDDEDPSVWASMASSHPGTDERIENLRDRAAQLRAIRGAR